MRPFKDRLSASFAWLNLTQFLGALNDNLFKLLLVFVLDRVTGGKNTTALVATASTVFVIPFLLFSHAGGVLADRFSKRNVIVAMKILEILVMLGGCFAVASRSATALYAALFCMCTQSALFGPSKYGIVPELVKPEQLSRANSRLVSFTYLAIILGTFIPSYLLLKVFAGNFLSLALTCVGVAAAGTLTSLGIEPTPPQRGHSRFTPFFVADIVRTLRSISSDRYLILTMIGAAYFTYVGAFLQQNLLLYGADFLKLTLIQSGYLFPVAAVGIGLGALLAGALSGRNIEFGVVPLGALGLAAGTVAVGLVPPEIKTVSLLIVWVGLSSGLFIVPLDAFVQYRSPAARRGEILACLNFLSFVCVALSAGTLVLLNKGLGLAADRCFVVIGVLTAVLAVAAIRVLPDFFVRFIIILLTRSLYRVRAVGLPNVPVAGGALLVSNHVTWVDALLIGSTLQRRIRFVMAREIAANRILRPLFKLMRVIPISPADPPRQVLASLKEARQALDDGYLVCIFAEGAITRTGNMHGFRPGLERIVKNSAHPIIPVCIGRAWGSLFSYRYGRMLTTFPKAIPYPVWVQFGRPLPPSASPREVRQAVMELHGESFALEKSPKRNLPRLFTAVARAHWFRPAIADSGGRRMTYGQALTAAVALSSELGKLAPGQDRIGILLPPSAGGALANLAVSLSGRVAVNLNFTTSRAGLDSALRQAQIRTVVSSREFLSKLSGVDAPAGTACLEDILPRITAGRKLGALLRARFFPAAALTSHRKPGPDDLATIIFSSGSTGEPKGVMLSHHNIISNLDAFRMVLRFDTADRMCGVLPFFHSFGYTCTLWCPLLTGFPVFYHPNPLDGAGVAAAVRENRLTLLLATPTFLLMYLRKASREDFASLRLVMAGAEKLKPRVAAAFEEKFGIQPLEGYGATELSPVGALNVPDAEMGGVRQAGRKPDSIGHPIPGVTIRIVDPMSRAPLSGGEEGLLLAKGPNVMMGYLGMPQRTAEVIADGWYDTGDMGRMDADGFVFLTGRLSRFSKIGGEMVPHVAIEDKLLEALHATHPVLFVTSVEDDRKGERLVVLHTDEAGDGDALDRIIRDSDLPNLWKPRREDLFRIDVMPTLGSGKLDLARLRSMAQETANQAGRKETGA